MSAGKDNRLSHLVCQRLLRLHRALHGILQLRLRAIQPRRQPVPLSLHLPQLRQDMLQCSEYECMSAPASSILWCSEHSTHV